MTVKMMNITLTMFAPGDDGIEYNNDDNSDDENDCDDDEGNVDNVCTRRGWH